MWLTLLDFKIGDQSLAMDLAKQFLDLLPTRKTLFPYTVEILTYLTNKGYQLHLITNGFEQTQHSKLKFAGIDSYFGEVITSEGSSFIKPNKEIFNYAFEKTKALPAQSIMIGDSVEVDIQGAINAGIDQVYVNHLNVAPIVQPTFIVYSLKELENIF
jgi:putative hydrolase of the HAD superfamily